MSGMHWRFRAFFRYFEFHIKSSTFGGPLCDPKAASAEIDELQW